MNMFAQRRTDPDPEFLQNTEIPRHLRLGPTLREAHVRKVEDALTGLEKNLPAPAPQRSNPLHPAVAGLVSQTMIAAAEQMAEEYIKAARMMFEEAKIKLEEAEETGRRTIEQAKAAAIGVATLHAKQRRVFEGQAQLQAEYEAEGMPAAEPESDPSAAVGVEPSEGGSCPQPAPDPAAAGAASAA